MRLSADDIQLDDGGYIRANVGGYEAAAGPGAGVPNRLGSTGAAHGGQNEHIFIVILFTLEFLRVLYSEA